MDNALRSQSVNIVSITQNPVSCLSSDAATESRLRAKTWEGVTPFCQCLAAEETSVAVVQGCKKSDNKRHLILFFILLLLPSCPRVEIFE